jgi:hypothetical protein
MSRRLSLAFLSAMFTGSLLPSLRWRRPALIATLANASTSAARERWEPRFRLATRGAKSR